MQQLHSLSSMSMMRRLLAHWVWQLAVRAEELQGCSGTCQKASLPAIVSGCGSAKTTPLH